MITFNNKQLPEWVSVIGVSFQSLNLSIVEYETKKRTGNIDAGVDKGGIEVTLDLFINPSSRFTIHDQADELKRFMRGDKWEVSPLILNEQSHKFYHARVSNASELTDTFTHGEMSLSFYCADPKKYDVVESVLNSTNGQVALEYFGLEKTPVDIQIPITQNVTNLTLSHLESDRKIVILGNLTVGQVVDIDTNNRNIKINGENAKHKMAFESNWLVLDEGFNTFTCSSPDLITNDFHITYRTAD